MFFDTVTYFIFLSIIICFYWSINCRKQNLLLLVGSYFFYGWWDWRFLGLILVSTIIDYYCAKYIAKSINQSQRRIFLTVSLTVNLIFLGFFKYFNFFTDTFVKLLGCIGVDNSPLAPILILLPPGISFYTFQEVAYIVDVYNRKIEPSNSLIDYALFVSLFPHLIAGPIQRPSHLLPQVQQSRFFNGDYFFDGLMLIVSGLFHKCVIADNCALLANAAFSGRLGEPNLFLNLIGIYAFAWQIYGDFSGYSDIARGSAQLLGFHFMVNFRQPYFAMSLQEFWRRWHISLSTWLRDYLYIPLGGSHFGARKKYRNLLLTMLLGGLWHGANWTYVLWGAIHGFGLCIEQGVLGIIKVKKQHRSVLGIWAFRIAIFHLVCLGWIFFRAQTVADSFDFLRGFGTIVWCPVFMSAFIFLVIFSVPLFLIDLINEKRNEEYPFEKSHEFLRVCLASIMILLVTFFSANDINAFIYFQF